MVNLILEKQNSWWQEGKISGHYFPRTINKEIIKNLANDKIIALTGSRQVGKTSIVYCLIDYLLKRKIKPANILYFNLDDLGIRELFQTPNYFLHYLNLKQDEKYIFLDEVQRLTNPGLFLKTIYDLKLPIKLTVTGSSQLEIRSKLKEFLVGRIRQFEIPRLSFKESRFVHPNQPKPELLESLLLYGSYPDIVKANNYEEKKLLLRDIYQTYLAKDISDFAKIENIEAFNKLLILLAAQIGNLLNIHNLANTLRLPVITTQKYLAILEGTFIIKTISPFFRNYKKEITKTPKIYFLDLGLRNFLLANWQPLGLRRDCGALFENFIFLEYYAKDIYKLQRYHFWRTTNQTEIDFIIEDGLKITAIETKYKSAKPPKSFATFTKYYPDSKAIVITPAKFLAKVK